MALTWARRLKRVFGIEIEQCVRCGGKLKVIASIEESERVARFALEPVLALSQRRTDRRSRSELRRAR